jgi:hypothetical protein
MGYGSVSYDPFTSQQAHLKIIGVDEIDGKFEDTPLQAQVEFKVLDYEESDDDNGEWIGWTFRDWFGFTVEKKTGNVGISKSPKAKRPNLIKGALPNGEQVIKRGEFESSMLMDREVRSKVVRSGKNEDGDHSRLKAETIMGKPKRPKKDQDLEGVDVENLDIPEAPDFSNIEEEKAS